MTSTSAGLEPAAVEDAGRELGASVRASAASEAGLRVVRDPVTGRIVERPTPEQRERLAEGVGRERRRSPEELKRFELSEGGEGVFLDGWADQAFAVERTESGDLAVTCARRHDHGADESKSAER
jgi:hypothetical protein